MDIERILQQAVQPTLDFIAKLEPRVPRSVRAVLVQVRLHVVEPGYTVVNLRRDLGAARNNWLASRFRATVGLSLWRFIQEGRLETGARLLSETSVQVGDVVILVGYEDPSSFTRLFRRWCGLTPGRFRHRARDAKARAGSIPRAIFNWFYLRRCVRFELTPPEVRDLIAYLEELFGPVERLPRPPVLPPVPTHPHDTPDDPDSRDVWTSLGSDSDQ